MATTSTEDQDRQQLLNQLYGYIKKNTPAKEVGLLTDFAKQYFTMVSYEDLAERKLQDIYGAMASHFKCFFKKHKGECKVNVFNPSLEKDGWESTHTIVEIVMDDMPFLVDSVQMEINRHGYLVHHIIHVGGMRVKRNAEDELIEILPRDEPVSGSYVDAPIYVEIDRQIEPETLENIRVSLLRVLGDVRIAVNDWPIMLGRLDQSLIDLEESPPPLDLAELSESKAFLRWLKENFILLGCRDYNLVKVGDQKSLQVVPNSSAGVLREDCQKKTRFLSKMPPEARKLALSPHILIIAKTNTKSTVHRSGYTDYVGVKVFDKEGSLIGERRFIGLYTSAAYNATPQSIPFLRLKVAKVLEQSGFVPNSHAAKKLLNILETLPRDDLFQAQSDELLALSMGIFHLQERQRIRLFIRKDTYGRFYSCLVFVPRESFNTELSGQMEETLRDMLSGEEVTYSILFTESILVRIHFMVRVDPKIESADIDAKEIEKRLIEIGMSWRQEFYNEMIAYFGEAKGVRYFNQYRNAFLAGYREFYNPRSAVEDVEHIESLCDGKPLAMNFYQSHDSTDDYLRFKVYQRESTVPLSDALPILEHMGFRVIGEHPNRVSFEGGECAWINDFNMTLQISDCTIDVERVKDKFQSAFAAVWLGLAENDLFNQLVVTANISWRQVTGFRAYAKYFQQIGFTFSQTYIAQTLINNTPITQLLIEYFDVKFNPKRDRAPESLVAIEEKFLQACDEVTNLAEDRILRYYLDAIKATVRTNYYSKSHTLAFKLMPSSMPGMPLPIPMFEIFVYSPRVEAVHLRGAKVARGGLRWSDRREDFRTEILGLMKAQQVKNAVIVPLGAKGGFVAKQLPVNGSREEILEEGIACYKIFIRALLELTDNIEGETIVPPQNIVRYDEDDPYLVVAADKGTATFSDIANEVSKSCRFWLGDAFASGGSAGYDHKKMGITARGAWESVKRHFREMNVDIQSTPFTVVGIGDMSGDVFGNGMLLSKKIRLVAAFNHIHIFIDPNPNEATSFDERSRLFSLPRSTWADYKSELISTGGGVYLRSLKSIPISPEMKKVFNISEDKLTPTELISAILKSPVDLLWNGGIGTYIKASTESNQDVGDRANDALRVNGADLTCKVVGEGGNLGCTQLGRVEFALNGGRIYTDFVDNSGGVDCSDHEVNIKILFQQVIDAGEMTEESRNQLLTEMTDEVANLVIKNNYEQTLAISNTADRSSTHLDLYTDLINAMEHKGILNRELEFLPSDKMIQERKSLGLGLTPPELAVLFAYSKTDLKRTILDSDLPEDPYFNRVLDLEFPERLCQKFKKEMLQHRLKREIIATQICNHLLNQMGITFLGRVQEETFSPIPRIVKAFVVSNNILGVKALWEEIESLDSIIESSVQFALMRLINRLCKRVTRWLLQNRPEKIDIETTITEFREPLALLRDQLPNHLVGDAKEVFDSTVKDFTEKKVPLPLARKVASCAAMFSALDIVEAAKISRIPLDAVLHVYAALNDRLDISWLRQQIVSFNVSDHWSALARAGLSDDLDFLQRMLTVRILSGHQTETPIDKQIDHWFSENGYLVSRWMQRITELKSLGDVHSIMFYVALRDFQDLTQSHRKLLVFR